MLTHPNGGELLVAGAPTVVTWTGVPATDIVKIEFSVDAGKTWDMITDKASGHFYRWDAPQTLSRECLVRVQSAGANALRPSHTLAGHAAGLIHIDWSPDGSKIATASQDNTAKVWDVQTGALLLTLQGHAGSVQHVAWSPDGSKIATGSTDNTARIWDARTGELLYSLRRHTGYIYRLAWSPDGSQIATASGDDLAIIWSTATGKVEHILYGHTNRVLHIDWNSDGSKIVTASSDKTAKIWDASSGNLLRTFIGHSADVYYVRWHPDNSKIATAGADAQAKIWDANSGQLLYTLQGHSQLVVRLNWHPSGLQLATASFDGTTKIWNAQNGNLLHTLQGHTDRVHHVHWNSDGTHIATASSDGTAIIWDSQTGTAVQTLWGHTSHVYHISWSPDKEHLETASFDGTAKIWDFAILSDTSDTTFSIVKLCDAEDLLQLTPLLFKTCMGTTVSNQFQLSNVGDTDLEVHSIEIEPADTDFVVLKKPNLPLRIGKGEKEIPIDISFSPQTADTKNAKLVIKDRDGKTLTKADLVHHVYNYATTVRLECSSKDALQSGDKFQIAVVNTSTIDKLAGFKKMRVTIAYDGTVVEGLGVTPAANYAVADIQEKDNTLSFDIITQTLDSDFYAGDMAIVDFSIFSSFDKLTDITLTVDNVEAECLKVEGSTMFIEVNQQRTIGLRAMPPLGKHFDIGQNYPNPSSTETTIDFSLEIDAPTTITLYNSMGEVVDVLVDQLLKAGTYQLNFTTSTLPSGKYPYRIASGPYMQTKQMVIVR